MDAIQDWRMMDAGWELNRLIAARLGYTVEGQSYRDSDDQFYFLLDPQRQPVIPNDTRMQAMVDGVKRTVREYSTPERAWRDVPPYSTSVDAALTLVDGMDYALLHQPEYGYLCKLDDAATERIEHAMCVPCYETWSALPSLAICRVWLAWQDALSPQADV